MSKRKLADLEVPDSKKMKSESGFVRKWLIDFKWLEFDEEKNKMFCTWCKKHNMSNKFSRIGVSNFKRSNLNDHARSDDHKTVTTANVSVKNDSLPQLFKKTTSQQDQAMSRIINTAYYVAKENVPISKFASLCELQLKNKTPLTSTLYQDSTSCVRFIDIISDQIEESTLNDIKKSPTVGIMIDESTDLATEKHLILYMNYLKDGKLQVNFVKLLRLGACDAVTISSNLIAFFDVNGIDKKKIFGFGSDGASVMLGKEGGVATLLKEFCPYLSDMHCAAHRLALACVKIADSVREVRYYESILSNLYSYFKRSSTNMSLLQTFQELLDDPKLKPHEIHSVRWLSMSEAIKTVRRSYKSLVHATEHSKDCDIIANSLYSNLTTFKFAYLTHLYSDIFGAIGILSKTLQTSGISYTSVQSSVDSFISNLETSYLSADPTYGPHLQQFLETVGDSDIFNGIELSRSPSDRQLQQSAFNSASLLIDNLKSRFRNMELFKSFEVFSPTNFPTEKRDLSVYGRQEINRLSRHYDGVVDGDSLITEFDQYKNLVFDNYRNLDTATILGVLKGLENSYTNVAKLIEISLVLPVTSVDCERGFSVQNLIKTRTRCSISVGHLDQLMRIMILGPSVSDFCPENALSRWKQRSVDGRDRHIYSKDGLNRLANF